MVADQLRLSDNMAMVYSIADIAAITWRVDTPEQVSQLKANGENVLGTMDPTASIGDEALKNIFYLHMQLSKGLCFGGQALFTYSR